MMDLRPCGRSGLLIELPQLSDVLDLYATLLEQTPAGVVDMVPAARTVLLHIDPRQTSQAQLEQDVRRLTPRRTQPAPGATVDIPVTYDGPDLVELGELTGWGVDGIVERHTTTQWTVAFCGFAPGFGYLVSPDSTEWNIPRRHSPRTLVPRGSVGLAAEFTGVYPRESPGGWQLIGHTDAAIFDLHRDPPALFTPGAQVRFTDVDTRS